MQSLCFVLETGKNLTDQDVLVLPMDVTAIDQLEFHFQQVIEHFGKVKISLYVLVSYLYNLRLKYLPYIPESNPHPFYSFRGLKIKMWIRIACRLDLWSRAGFWKNDRTAVVAIRTIK